jgi:hypothetical protein
MVKVLKTRFPFLNRIPRRAVVFFSLWIPFSIVAGCVFFFIVAALLKPSQ